MTVDELKKQNELMSDSWRLLAKFGQKIEDTDEFKEELKKAADVIVKKYNHSQFAIDQVLAVVNEIDRQLVNPKQQGS